MARTELTRKRTLSSLSECDVEEPKRPRLAASMSFSGRLSESFHSDAHKHLQDEMALGVALLGSGIFAREGAFLFFISASRATAPRSRAP